MKNITKIADPRFRESVVRASLAAAVALLSGCADSNIKIEPPPTIILEQTQPFGSDLFTCYGNPVPEICNH